MEQKILPISDDDFDTYGDYLDGTAVERFINGHFTHVAYAGQVMSADVYTDRKGERLVAIGEGA